MKYEIVTYKGIKLTISEVEDFDAIKKVLNSQEIDAISISNVSMLKNNVQFIRPVYTEGEEPAGDAVNVYTNRLSEPFRAHVENFDAADISSQVNTRTQAFIVIGDTIINRQEYSMVLAVQ